MALSLKRKRQDGGIWRGLTAAQLKEKSQVKPSGRGFRREGPLMVRNVRKKKEGWQEKPAGRDMKRGFVFKTGLKGKNF